MAGTLVGTLALAIVGDMAKFRTQLKADASKAGDEAGTTFSSQFKSRLSAVNIGKAVGGALAGGFALAAKGALEMEERQAAFQAATGASAEEARHFADELNAMGGRSLVAMNDLAQAMTMIRTDLGLSGEEADVAAGQFERYMRATGQGATAVSAFDDILDAWNLTAADSQAIMDTLIAGQQEYGGVLTESQDTLAKLAPALQAANLGWEDATELINLANAAGVDATAMVTGMTKALGQVESPEELNALIRDIATTEDAFERGQKAADLFGAKAGVKIAQVLQASGGDLEQFGFTLDEVAGKTEKAADALDNTITSKFRLFLNEAGSLIRGLGMELGPMLTGAMSAVWLAQSIGLGKFFGPMGAQAAGLFSSAFAVVQRGLSSVFSGLGGMVDRAGAMLGGRFGLAFKVGAVAAVALLWVEVWNQYNQFQEKVAGAQKDLAQKAAGAATQAGEEAIANLGNTVKGLGELQGFDRVLADTFGGKESMEALRNLGAAILADTSLTAAQIEQGVTNMNAAAVEAQARGNQAIADELRTMAETLSMREPTEAVEEGGRTLVQALQESFEGIGQQMRDFRPPDIDGPIEDEFDAAREAIVQGFGSIKDALANPPQLISREDRLDNMADRFRKVMKRLHQAVQEDDPFAIDYWTKAAIKQRDQMARMRQNTTGSIKDVRQAFKAAGVDIDATWLSAQRGADTTREKVEGVEDAIDDLPSRKGVTVTVDTSQALGALATFRQRLLETGQGTAYQVALSQRRGEMDGRQYGGRVEAGRPYLVGEVSPEMFIPDVPGRIAPRPTLVGTGGGDGGPAASMVNLEVHGLPMRAETPLEVVRQLRRATSMGIVNPKRRASWAPA